PWMPFITEELWQHLKTRAEGDCIIISEWPVTEVADKSMLAAFGWSAEVITQVRNLRSSKGISPKESLVLQVRARQDSFKIFDAVIIKLANLTSLEEVETKSDGTFSFLAGVTECYVPLAGRVDVDAERERLNKELEYNQGFLKSVQSKLSNDRFVANAKPEVVENEKKKMADALTKIKSIEEQLAGLS
ncbi:MAG: class I tRNA ligase family protein, partial [Bacteroidota bacterium]